MGSSSKKTKEKECRKRRHYSPSESLEREAPREKKHRHHRRHHRDRKREKHTRRDYESEDSDVIEILSGDESQSSPPRVVEEERSPEPSTHTESLSIEETNKLRAKLGLKPLHVEDKSSDKSSKKNDEKKKDDLGEFYHKPAESWTERKQQEKIRNKLVDHKEKRSIENKLSKVKLLGEADSDDDIGSWVDKTRKIEDAKKEAEKRAKMLEELDEQFGVGDIVESEQRMKRNKRYNEKNLRGLQVDHDVDSFREGQTVILTLKDQEVLAEDSDVLINVNMLDDERYKKNIENKKKKDYYANEMDEEIDEFGILQPKAMLKKYDVEIDGEKRDGFKIGYDNAAERKQAMLQNIKEKLSNKILENLNTTELNVASDYYNEQELAKFKKPKKKVRKMRAKSKVLTADDLEEVAGISKPKKKKQEADLDYDDIPDTAINTKVDVKLEDDNDVNLEKALSKAKRLKQKETTTNFLAPIEVFKNEPMEENAVDPGSIVLNATAEFCRTLGDIPTYGKSGNREDGENLEEFEKDYVEDMDTDELIETDEGGKWNAVDPNRIIQERAPAPIEEKPILDEEPDVSSGVAAALKLAMSKGYLDKGDNNRPSNSRLAHLQAQHYSIEDKSYGDEMERTNRRERYTGPIMDFKEKDAFKPNVKLEYIDDEGHVLNAKEAFRYLSHKFHGKGPGKNKVEKRLKKSQQEGLMKKMSSTDTPLGTLNMLQSKQKEMQSPYIVLSGGKHTHSTTISKARR